MASAASQLIEEVTAHAQRDSLEDAREICADGIYFTNNLRIWVETCRIITIHILKDIAVIACYYPHTFSIIMVYTLMFGGPGSSVGIATDYGLVGLGLKPGRDEIFRPSRPVLGPTQPLVKEVPALSPGVKCGQRVLLTTQPLLVPRLWKSRAIPLPTLWATPGL